MKELDSYCSPIDNTIFAYVKDYHTCSDIFSQPVNAGMDNTSPRTRRLKGWHVSKCFLPFLKNTPKYLLMKKLDSYCSSLDNTIFAYLIDYHTCSGIFC